MNTEKKLPIKYESCLEAMMRGVGLFIDYDEGRNCRNYNEEETTLRGKQGVSPKIIHDSN
jgi:hypothetical protein